MKYRIVSLSIIGFLAIGPAVFAQQPGSGATGGAAAQGFNVQTLISKLSLFLPENLMQGQFVVGGRNLDAGGQGGGGQAQGGQSSGGQGVQRNPLNFTRDPKLFLTKDQIAKLLPILLALRENPMPSPTKAKKVEADVDAILTKAQKAEWDQFQKALEKLRQSFQQQSGSSGGQQFPDFENMTEQERQNYLNSLPEDQRQRIQQRMQQGGGSGGQQLTPLQRRQRQVESFIKALQDYQKQLG